MTLTAETIQPDLGAVKHRQKTVWSSGDYPAVGTTLQITGEQLAEAMDLMRSRASTGKVVITMGA